MTELISAPIAYPIAKLLDYFLGENESHTYRKSQLKSFLQFHRTGAEPLQEEEIGILNGVLELGAKHVETIMTPMEVIILNQGYNSSITCLTVSSYPNYAV